jgi:hypothetical protein
LIKDCQNRRFKLSSIENVKRYAQAQDISAAFVFAETNIEQNGEVTYLPAYMATLFVNE